ncbi:class I SAM-dependent methyltransferase [Bacillus massiliglaciei]|uniref:class I SAM-dependent methyltransferase n=1 Tax=Bacillus massiliglaciei TaxID=1816693 RepID=UPI000B06106C|nr:methyltransferase domain-containing protein [Bacillus massiliglaciei]
MPNDDQINLRYYGLINTEKTQKIAQFRIHWMCKMTEGKTVLDVGCSQGITSILLGREGFQVTGIDIEQVKINYANKELKKESKIVQDNVKFLLSDVTVSNKKLGKFDTVILGEVLEHFSQPHKLLKAVFHLLNYKGRIIITVPFGLHPFHDHKQTFYLLNLMKLLECYFDGITLEIHNKYIHYVGRKKKKIVAQKNVYFSPDLIEKWMQLEEQHFLQFEKENEKLLKDRKNRLEIKENQINDYKQRLEKTSKQLDSLYTLLNDKNKNEPKK